MTREDRIAEVLGAWQEARDAGRFVDPESIYAEHPDLADELRLRFAALDVVEQAYAETRMFEGQAPRRLGEYEIKRELGRGGMGVVYEAVQTSMHRTVALKVLFPSVTSSRRAVERFQREARAAGRVQHTNIVPVYSLNRDAGAWYYAMELVEGSSLSTILRRERELGDAPVEAGDETTTHITGSYESSSYHHDVARLFSDVSDALQTAHEEGVIHRDVKPSNLILDQKGVLKIVDFGIARVAGEVSEMTMTGELLGTPAYMSPEQARGTKGGVDHRSDVYSLGATLYEALTLQAPFDGRTFGDVYEQILTTEPQTPRQRNRSVPRDLETVVLKAMEKEPRRRYDSAGAMARDLRAFAEGRAIGARRITAVEKLWRRVKRHKTLSTAAVLLVALVVAALGFASRASEEEDRRRGAEYDLLLRRAVEVLPSDHAAGYTVGGAAVDLYSRAIDLQRDRPEAYVGRALLSARTLEEQLADVEAARARGVKSETADRLRAVVLHGGGRADEARIAEGGLPEEEAGDLLGVLARGLRAQQMAQTPKAIAWFGRVVDEATPGSLVSYLARRGRARLLLRQGKLSEALKDVIATRAQGDRGPGTTAMVASLWRKLGQPEKAEHLVDRTLEKGLDDAWQWDAFIRECMRNAEYGWALRAAREAVAAHPEDGVLRSLYGHALSIRGQPKEALVETGKGVELAPEAGLTHALHALTLSQAQQHEDAERVSKRALKLSPRNPWIRQIRAGVLRDAGRPDEAYAATEAVLAIDPTWSGALRLQGLIRRDQERLDDAMERLTAALKLAPHEAQTLAAIGEIHERQGNLDAARKDLLRAVELQPDNATYQYNLGVVYSDLGEDALALEPYRRAVALKPNYVNALFNLGYTLQNLERFDEALEQYRAVAKHDPRYKQLWLETGSCHWGLGDTAAALKAYEHALHLRPDYLEARANKASLLNKMNRRTEALAEFEQILAKRPDLGVIWFNKGLALLALKRPEEALEAFTEAGERVPGDADPHTNRATILVQLGRRDDAEKALYKAVESAPESALTTFNLALFLAQTGKFDDSRRMVERCLTADPEYAKAHNLLGQLQLRDKEKEAALKSMRRAIKLDRRFEYFRHNLATALIHMKRYPEAADVLGEAVRDFKESAKAATWFALVLTTAPDPQTWAPERALTLARKALTLQGADRMTRLALAAALHRNKRHAEALREVELARRAGNVDPLGALIEALAYHALGKESEARERLRTTDGKTHPRDARPQTDLARSLRLEAERLIGTSSPTAK